MSDFLLQCKEILQEEEDLSEIVQLVGKVRFFNLSHLSCSVQDALI